MKTPERSVSEIVEEFEKKWKDDEFYSKLHEYEDINAITDWLTQTLKAERQKREELVEEACKIVEDMMEDEENWQPIVARIEALTQPNNHK